MSWIQWSTAVYKMVCCCSERYCTAEGNSTGHRAALSCSSDAQVRVAAVARRRSAASSRKSSLRCCRLQGAQRPRSSLDMLWRLWTLDALCVHRLETEATRTVHLRGLSRSVRLMRGHKTTTLHDAIVAGYELNTAWVKPPPPAVSWHFFPND